MKNDVVEMLTEEPKTHTKYGPSLGIYLGTSEGEEKRRKAVLQLYAERYGKNLSELIRDWADGKYILVPTPRSVAPFVASYEPPKRGRPRKKQGAGD